jgi:phosphoribosylformylglycinamidine cyclo-ligase
LLVSSTDGGGTKIEIANKFKKFDTIGIDLVAMCVNDLIVQGAKPLFFLDYIAVPKINLKKMKSIIKGVVTGCKISDCMLVGGETAEMPGTYTYNKFDLAGFAVGVVSKNKLLHKGRVKNNDVILAVPSSGLHSNGFSLVRHILKKQKINNFLKRELIEPTKIYANSIVKLSNKNLLHAAVNITGGGLIENIPRSIPNGYTANIDLSKIKVLNIFKWIKSKNVSDLEMLKTFNCGVGFCIITDKQKVKKVKKFFSKKFEPYQIGYINKSSSKINFIKKIKW